MGQLRLHIPASWSDFELASAGIYMAALVLVSYGYFIGLSKSILIPAQQIVFLGFISDSVKQAFILLEEKKLKFAMLKDSILSSNLIVVKTLQRFVEKAHSLWLFLLLSSLDQGS